MESHMTNPHDTRCDQATTETTEQPQGVSRRGFLKGAAATALASAGVAGGVAFPSSVSAAALPFLPSVQRRVQALRIRQQAALIHFLERIPPQFSNGDEERYADKRASFSKGLAHNALGEVDLAAFAAFRRALDRGVPAELEAVPLSPIAARKLVNPQGAYAFDMTGVDAYATPLPPGPLFASAEAAAEVGEIYWMALAREIPFRDFASDPLIAAAVADLNAFSEPQGPKQGGLVTPGTLFRGDTPGDLIGPYISQWLWLPVRYGPSDIVQQYLAPLPGQSFMTNFAEWLSIQQGAAPVSPETLDTTPRYLHNLRGLAGYVHNDAVFQCFLNAALIISPFGPPALDPANPYLASHNQTGFVTFGIVDILDLATKAARVALEGAWFHKWVVHRRLRPEVFGGRIEVQRLGSKNYGVHPDIMGSEVVARVLAQHGSALLPQVYPEGAPLHPSYPAGHAAIAGACATVLKAFFDEAFVIPNPVEASPDGLYLDPWGGADLRLGNEINKLATNLSVGRCAAGIHYRSDSRGIDLGEDVAIGILQDFSLTYNEDFAGFTLTKFDGQRIRIADGRVLAA